jgi:hypothetical protein
VAKLVYEKFGVRLRAEARFKRYYAERMIREVKLRLSFALKIKGK